MTPVSPAASPVPPLAMTTPPIGIPVPVAVTTTSRFHPERTAQARALAASLNVPFVPRRDETLAEVADFASVSRLLVVEHAGLRLVDLPTGTTYAHHANLLPIRAASLGRGEPDLFVQAAQIRPGDHVLDCTLGFGTEATLAGLLAGLTGSVLALESAPALAEVTRAGLQSPARNLSPDLRAAMRRVQVVCTDSLPFLQSCSTHSFDIVCFDPFFGERLRGSEQSVSPLALFGDTRALPPAAITQAQRVARKRVVLKAPKADPLPPAIAALVSESFITRKSRVCFYLFSPSPPS